MNHDSLSLCIILNQLVFKALLCSSLTRCLIKSVGELVSITVDLLQVGSLLENNERIMDSRYGGYWFKKEWQG